MGFDRTKGSWINLDKDLLVAAKDKKIELPEKIQGEQKLVNLIEEDKKVQDFLLKFINNLISSI